MARNTVDADALRDLVARLIAPVPPHPPEQSVAIDRAILRLLAGGRLLRGALFRGVLRVPAR